MLLKIVIVALVVAVGANEVEDEVNKYTLHIHPLLKANLNLTTGELKLFAGHSMNMIHAKCPSVDATRIFQIQKYIGKLIAKAGPVAGTSETFKKILETVTECTKEGEVSGSSTPEPQGSRFFDSILAPFHSIRTFWVMKTTPDTVPEETASGDEDSELVDSGLVPQPEYPSPPSTNPDDAVETDEDQPTLVLSPQTTEINRRTGGGVLAWIRSVFQRMGSAFHGMFTYPIRKRRDASDLEVSEDEDAPIAPQESEEPLIVASSDGEELVFHVQPQQPISAEPEAAAADTGVKLNSGKAAFAELVDHMCEVYCSTCSHPAEIVNYKKAAKQLLIFLFSEDSDNALELGANKFLDQDFLNSITRCERGQ